VLKLRIMATALAASTALTAVAAWAQSEPGRDDSVLTRERPEFDALGIRAGTFLLFPSLTGSVSYDDNIFADADDEEDDIIYGVLPALEARSQWSRHSLALRADVDAGFYSDNDDSNYVDYGIAALSRIDVIGQSAIRINAFARQEHEDRDSQDEAGDEDVTDLFDARLNVNYRHVFNRLFVQPGFDIRRRDFDDVGDINNDDRDRFTYRGDLRVGYAVRPGLAVFGLGEVNTVRYDETPDDGGVERDSEGARIGAGFEIDLTGKVVGEFDVGYSVQEYDDNDLDDFSGPTAGGQITWNVTPLTAIIGGLRVEIEETTVALDGERASSKLVSDATLNVVHELRRNILLRGGVGFTRDDFEGIDRTDDTFDGTVGASYLITRNLSVDLDYDYTNRDSDVDNGEFTRNVIMLGLRAQL